jgi:membrane-associated protein
LEIFASFLSIMQDLPGHLAMWTAQMGPWVYILLFAIVFAETGLIVLPFLPGDSLLFAVGAMSALGSLHFLTLLLTLIAAAVLGDALNYAIGKWLGLRLFKNPQSRIFNPRHLERTEAFYKRHGGKTIVIARFMPVFRTYAPFVAGLSRMPYRDFFAFNFAGGALWILSFLSLGHFFGNLPQVKNNFHYVIAAIIIISFLPAVIEFIRSRRQQEPQL